jgi:hypothetical protein
MSAKQLFVPMALIGMCLVGISPASAVTISFSENPDEKSNILVATDISGATITTLPETASLTVGDVTGGATVLFRRQMVGATPGEDGVAGISDFLELTTFRTAAGVVVGFKAEFVSDAEAGLSPPVGNFPAGVTNLPEDGTLQLLTPADFSVTLPGVGLVPLSVSAQSDAEVVPGPIVGAGLPGLIAACLGLLVLARRRRKIA